MAHGDAREGKWRGNWRMEWVVSTLHATSEHVQHYYRWCRTPRLPVVDWTDAPCRFKWTRPFRRKTKSGFCPCAITFQLASTYCICTLHLKTWKSRQYWNPRLYILALCVFDVPHIGYAGFVACLSVWKYSLWNGVSVKDSVLPFLWLI